jgi:hypothetical protein
MMIKRRRETLAFGPDGALKFERFDEWAKEVLARNCRTVPASSSLVAHSRTTNACIGVWYYETKPGADDAQGWVE